MSAASAVTDFSQYTRMRLEADADDPGALREVAGQFEALFVETLLKNMRSSSLGDPIFGNSHQHEMYLGLLDQQLAVEMAKGPGIGIADLLARQLGGEHSAAPGPAMPERTHLLPGAAANRLRAPTAASITTPNASSDAKDRWDSPIDFVRDIWPHAERAGRDLDIDPRAIIAQAALETGWGAQVIRDAEGRSSFNLFGIKAGSDWQGARIARPTLEYRDGVAYRELAKFRAYPDVHSTFDDYAAFLGESPRYASVVGSGRDVRRFADALQAAGYATDPNYADKIGRVLNGETFREAIETLKINADPPIYELSSPTSAR